MHPETPPEGRSLETLFAGRGVDLEAIHDRMAELMRAEGLPYGKRTHTYNSRLAQELGKWADTQEAETIHDALYRAYFVEGRNISDRDELIRLAQSVGLPADDAGVVLHERPYRQAVDTDWAKSARYGITGVPTFVAGTKIVVGAQPYEVLEQLVTVAGAVRRIPS